MADPRPGLAAPPVTRALLEDGSLALSVEAAAWDAVASWVPRVPAREPAPGEARAWIRVGAGAPAFELPAAPAAMELYGVRGWTAGGAVVLADGHRRIGARVELESRRAEVRVDTAGPAPDAHDVFAVFTIAAGLLLARLGRALLHAAAVVAPDGGAWLLPGSSFSGKSTTCITLIRAGWNYLCDDHVVLGRGAGGELRAEGWPRPFGLDRGYALGASEGVRGRVEPHLFGPGAWQRSAPVAGVLVPRVEAGQPTTVTPVHPAASLAQLLRQSPFMVSDPAAAPGVLALLEMVAKRPSYELRLGFDSYCNPERLQLALRAATVA
ncbi:MAG TPA: hypothetical protein VFJ82_00590 [Longimicrobium sp.]|nr:hypothetical protein [Longimicrobium sp.]